MAVTRVRIRFEMYSGRPDPVAVLAGEAADDLLRRIVPGEPIAPEVITEVRSQLGYRGVVIEQPGQPAGHLPESFRLAGGRLTGLGLRHWVADPQIEDFICAPDGPAGLALTTAAEFDALAAGLAAIREPGWWWEPRPEPPRALERCPTAPPPAEFEWNDANARGIDCRGFFKPAWCIQCCNNCYNYATNIRTDSAGQPGLGSGKPTAQTTGEAVCRAAYYDGLIVTPVALGATCVTEGILVALAVEPNVDFHWYRKCDDGYWWHKQGATGVKNTDARGNPITDPRTCDRGPYEFVTFMTVPPGGVRIAGPREPDPREVSQ